MPFVLLGVAAAGFLGVGNAYLPAPVQPFSTLSFLAGLVVGELALQLLVLSGALVAALCTAGALTGWAGWLGFALALVGWAGLVGLALVGFRSKAVVAAALADPAAGLPGNRLGPGLPSPRWGRWWRVVRAFPLRAPSASVVPNIDYWGDGARRHRLDVIRPAGPTAGAPVLVYVHGGAWMMGSKWGQGRPLINELVARGWVCVALNYRLSPQARWPDHIVDCKRALAWVKGNIGAHGGDPGFVVLSGGSAGGQLCALAALTADDQTWQPGFEDVDTSVRACVPIYGVMDMTGGEKPGRYGSALVRLLERRVMGTTLAADRALFENASPLWRVHEKAPPFFVLHGTHDTMVPVAVARRFVAALRSVSRSPVVYAELPLAQHAFDVISSPRSQAAIGGIVAFLELVRGRKPSEVGRPARKVVRARAFRSRAGGGTGPGTIRWLNRYRPEPPRPRGGPPGEAPAARSDRRP